MGKSKDISGQKFGKLLAINPVGSKNNKTIWLCQCDCGKIAEVAGAYLRNGNTKSCGCITKKHGMFGTRIYNVWHTMKERCYVKKQISYPNYGGKGIKVCDEWQDFIPFMEWAYANGYDENAPRGQCTLDRIDPNGDYCPENCRWVDASVQANNKSTNVFLEYNGVVDTLSNHARRLGVNPVLAEGRYLKQKPLSDVFKVGRVGDVKKVAQYDKDMNLIKIWDSCTEISKTLGYKINSLRGNLAGYSKTCKGYIWKYYDEEG